jgi:hypothetical protein
MNTKITIYSLIAAALLALNTYAAQDPAVSNPNVTPSPAIAGQNAQFSFNIGNAGSTAIPGTSAAQQMRFTLTLSSGVAPTNPDGLSSISGTISTYFDITYDATQRLYRGIQKPNVALPPFTLALIVVQVTTIAEPISALVNIQPNAIASSTNQPVSNDVATINTALPVTLTSFNVTKENTTANLAWSTTEETNSERFDIEHSLDAKRWTVIGTQKSNGESSILRNYTFPHATPGKGTNYYRLKMIDMDGTFAYSSTRSIDIDQALINVYPNPVADVLTIGTSLTNLSRVQLYNTNGTSVYDSGKNVTDKIAVGNLSGGIYLVLLSYADGTSDTRKIVVKK